MIVQAACKVSIPNINEVRIIPLHRHGDMGKIFAAFGYKLGECKILEQGFVDSRGNFYNRKEALREAMRCEQLFVEPIQHGELFSENLY